MTAAPTSDAPARVFRVFIRATPEAIWDAITNPEWTERYGYRAPMEYDLRPGGAFRARSTDAMRSMGGPDTVVDGEVIEADPPRKLVQTWRFLWAPELVAEGFTRVTWEIAPSQGGVTRLTVTHEVAGAPRTTLILVGDDEMGAGWPFILSDLKTLLESGTSLQGS